VVTSLMVVGPMGYRTDEKVGRGGKGWWHLSSAARARRASDLTCDLLCSSSAPWPGPWSTASLLSSEHKASFPAPKSAFVFEDAETNVYSSPVLGGLKQHKCSVL
jgi:hypothetical protein